MGVGCKQALDCFADMAAGFGLNVENHQDHCLSVLLPGRTDGHELGILGHLDVVPAGTGWKYDPFAAIEKNGFIIGRGACDNKGPMVMALYLLRCLRELRVPLRGGVRLIAGCDEEGGMRDIRHFLSCRSAPDFTLNCDGAWPLCIGEKGILTADLLLPLPNGPLREISGGEASNMVPASAGALLLGADPAAVRAALAGARGITAQAREGGVFLLAQGKAAHCAVPSAGENAIRALVGFLCAPGLLPPAQADALKTLRDLLRDDEGTALGLRFADPLSGATTVTGALLSLRNGLLRLSINARFAVSQPIPLLESRLRERCARLGVRLEALSILPPRLDSPDQPEIRLLLDTAREFLHPRLQPYVSGGGTHSRLFPRSVPFGTGTLGRPSGSLGGPHAPDEAVSAEELILGLKIYTAALLRLDRQLAGRAKTV